jgi:dinuclear metal center YbgI/SA1388 family protein
MTVAEVIAELERVAPARWAEPTDHVGLQVGREDFPVDRLLVALDATPEVVAEAREFGAQMMVVHHPLIRTPLPEICPNMLPNAALWELVRAGMALYVAHTNLDASPRIGTSTALTRLLGLPAGEVLMPVSGGGACSGGEPAEALLAGQGRIVELAAPTTAPELCAWAGDCLQTKMRLCFGTGSIRRLVVFPGSAATSLEPSSRAGADGLLCGEMNHHAAQAAVHAGLNVVQLGHYATECPVVELVRDYLAERLGDRAQVVGSQINTDPYA